MANETYFDIDDEAGLELTEAPEPRAGKSKRPNLFLRSTSSGSIQVPSTPVS
jgi:hypothetical protein